MTRLEELGLEAKQRGVHVVTEATAGRYGLTQEEWLTLLEGQGWRCGACHRYKGVTMTTDHEHVPGWKKMSKSDRKRYVRGILCQHCNYRVVHSRLTAATAGRIAEYLRAYEKRRDNV